MSKNIHVKIVSVASILTFIVIQYLNSDKPVYENMSNTISITLIIWGLYVRWLWRLNVFSDYPILKKHYKGTFISDYDNKNRDVKIKIYQTLTSVNIYFETNESVSKSVSSQIYKDDFGYILGYIYLNHPSSEARNRSEIHYGYVQLEIDGDCLKGSYFTDRKTAGNIFMKPYYPTVE